MGLPLCARSDILSQKGVLEEGINCGDQGDAWELSVEAVTLT